MGVVGKALRGFGRALKRKASVKWVNIKKIGKKLRNLI